MPNRDKFKKKEKHSTNHTKLCDAIATVDIDYKKAHEEVSYELHLAKELIDKYRAALLNLALDKK